MRINGLQHQVTTGNVNGKRSRGRQRAKHRDGLTKWSKQETPNKVIQDVYNREEWRATTVNAGRHDN